MNFDSVGRVMLLEFQVRVEIWVFNLAICELVWPGSLLMKEVWFWRLTKVRSIVSRPRTKILMFGSGCEIL